MDFTSTLATVRTLIDSGKDYEAQQQILAKSRRTRSVDASISLLDQGARLLLAHGKVDSGISITLELVSFLEKKSVKSDEGNKTVIKELLKLMPISQPSAGKLIGKVVGWSTKNGEFPAGDPDLHDVIGDLYANASEAYKAETHLLLGTSASVSRLARLEYDWYLEDEPTSAGLYIARAVLPYLLLGNLCFADRCHRKFMELLESGTERDINAPTSTPSESSTNTSFSSPASSTMPRFYENMPLLNFITLLIPTVARKDQNAYSRLRAHYKTDMAASPAAQKWAELLDQIGEGYFGLRQQMPSNPLFDMMGSFFGGGGFGGAGGGNGGRQPAIEGLD